MEPAMDLAMDLAMTVTRFERRAGLFLFVCSVHLDGADTVIYRTYDEFYRLQHELNKVHDDAREEMPYVPLLRGPKRYKTRNMVRKRVAAVNRFLTYLSPLDTKIARPTLREFVSARPSDMSWNDGRDARPMTVARGWRLFTRWMREVVVKPSASTETCASTQLRTGDEIAKGDEKTMMVMTSGGDEQRKDAGEGDGDEGQEHAKMDAVLRDSAVDVDEPGRRRETPTTTMPSIPTIIITHTSNTTIPTIIITDTSTPSKAITHYNPQHPSANTSILPGGVIRTNIIGVDVITSPGSDDTSAAAIADHDTEIPVCSDTTAASISAVATSAVPAPLAMHAAILTVDDEIMARNCAVVRTAASALAGSISTSPTSTIEADAPPRAVRMYSNMNADFAMLVDTFAERERALVCAVEKKNGELVSKVKALEARVRDLEARIAPEAQSPVVVGATRAVRDLESKVHKLSRKRNALATLMTGIKRDVHTEREARRVVERCFTDRHRTNERKVADKKADIVELRDRARELEDELLRAAAFNDGLQSFTSPPILLPPLPPLPITPREPIKPTNVGPGADVSEVDDLVDARELEREDARGDEGVRLYHLLISNADPSTLLVELNVRCDNDDALPASTLRALTRAMVCLMTRHCAAGRPQDDDSIASAVVARYGVILAQWACDDAGMLDVLNAFEVACEDTALLRPVLMALYQSEVVDPEAVLAWWVEGGRGGDRDKEGCRDFVQRLFRSG
ncbi:hypothetical protein HK101_008788 [Irineochytrium annulatum]|nr:hypothetical protein HK101_008788 [Irineochytrium annulatum]